MRSQAAKLFIQISNLFPPFNGCLQENIKMCQTDHFKIEYQLNVKIKWQNYFYTEANPKKLFGHCGWNVAINLRD